MGYASRSRSSTPASRTTRSGSYTESSVTRRTRSGSTFTRASKSGSSGYQNNNKWKGQPWQTGGRRKPAGSMYTRSTSTSLSDRGHTRRRRRAASSVMSDVADRIPPPATTADDDTSAGQIDLADADEHWVTSITESKGSTGVRSVGIAAFQPSTATCLLTQLNDSQTYIKTVHTLSVRWPSMIFMPNTGGMHGNKLTTAAGGIDPSSSKYEETQLTQYLKATFGERRSPMSRTRQDSVGPSSTSPSSSRASSVSEYETSSTTGVRIFGIARRYYDPEAGMRFCTELNIQDDETTATNDLLRGKYYALSAVSALFKCMESTFNRTFASHTVKIRYVPLEGTMLIDTDSAKNLELVENLLDKKGKHTLYGFLNHCYTPMATRLLRSNILSPSTDLKLIETRLDVVAELIDSDDRFRNVRKALKSLERIDADKITSSLQTSIALISTAKRSNKKNADPSKESEKKLALMLQLRAFIKAIPQIRNCLVEGGGCKSSMLNTIGEILGDERLDFIDNDIEQVLSSMTKTALSARTSRVFAIKAEKKKLLDVARETYKENINDVDDLLKDLQMKYPGILDDIELAYSTTAGFTFLLHEETVQDKGGDLPRIFSKLSKRGKKIVFTCVDLLKRNQRIQQSLDEVFLLSSEVLDELLGKIHPHIAVLYRCSEVLAMLDMLVSFAHVATTSASYVRPEFTDTLAIKDGRHPVLERYRFTDGAFVPNDTYASDASTFQILTGPNMSGKTTFLKQIAMLVIMSQIGSYVPADYASFRPHDALLTRLSNDDSIEGNLSTFALEMKSMAMIISALSSTSKALVLVDELGRGTSPQEGVGIAHAIAEEIIRSKAFCFFATHFLDLSTTLSVYPNVVTLHLETDMASLREAADFDKNFALTFSHRVRDGRTTATNYGIEIAKVAALPDDMLLWAKEAADRLSHLEESRRQNAPGTKVAGRRRILLTAAADMRQAYSSSRMSENDLRDYLESVQDKVVQDLATHMPTSTEKAQSAGVNRSVATHAQHNGMSMTRPATGAPSEDDTLHHDRDVSARSTTYEPANGREGDTQTEGASYASANHAGASLAESSRNASDSAGQQRPAHGRLEWMADDQRNVEEMPVWYDDDQASQATLV